MSIVIVGAGDVGLYLAQILSKEEHNIILVDKDGKKLQHAANLLDVATREGSGTDWQLLDDLLELSPTLFISLTDDDETNLVACAIAKNLGYPRTIARVRDNRYLNRTRLDFSRIFEIDFFISPELLAATDILKHITNPGSISTETFAHGAVQLRILEVPQKWRKSEIPLKKLSLPEGAMIGLISRESHKQTTFGASNREIIFPHGDDVILPGDEVTVIGETPVVAEIHHFFGIVVNPVSSVTIVGGSLTGFHLARLLIDLNISVKLIDISYERCCRLADLLPEATIVHHDATDLTFLKEEKIGRSQIFVSCTRHDELNVMTGLLAKEAGCEEVIAILANNSYQTQAKVLGINLAVSPRQSAANHILSQILTGRVTSLVSVYDNSAEIMEVNVSAESKVVGIPLSELGPLLPKDFLIAMIQNRGRIMIANGTRIISPSDTVIAITSPRHVDDLEKIF
jgi:trk system potassium uptake protein TrkA